MNIYFFIGTMAELIKVAPIMKELRQRRIKFRLIATGQNNIHWSELSFYLGKIKPDWSFEYKGEKSSIIHFFLWTIRACFWSLLTFRNIKKNGSYVIVHGDTISALLGALVAKFYRLRLVHVEAGLRTFSLREPFPEEITRILVSYLADVSFCPNLWAVNNLGPKGGRKINTFQNTLFEIHRATIKLLPFGMEKTFPKKYFVLVIHRQEHTLLSRKETKKLIEYVLKKAGNLLCVLIMHRLTNDFLRSMDFNEEKLTRQGVITVPRLSYPQFIELLAGAQYLITDGGSNQEEATYLGLPCLLLRKKTERIEGLGENVVLSRLHRKTIAKFQAEHQSYRRRVKLLAKLPAKIIVDHLMTIKHE